MKQYVVDAFADRVFSGNPAAICILEHWLSDELMQTIALENNLSETAFAVKKGHKYHLRWFTLSGEIDLCGHATMACAYVLFHFYETDSSCITFETRSGDLVVQKRDALYEMNFPSYALTPVPVTQAMTDAIGVPPEAAYMGRDLLCVLPAGTDITQITLNLEKVQALDGLLLHVTMAGENTDCVSRSFAPKCNCPEDPVCGSGHCHIAPYWATRLQKEELVAYQASRRGGTLYCRVKEGRVMLSGKAALFSISEIFLQ